MLPHSVKTIQKLAQRPIQTVSIQEMLARSARVTDQQHIQHAQWLREELPVRLAHRLSDYVKLPYMVVCNSSFHEIFRSLTHAFDTLHALPAVTTIEEVNDFATLLEKQVDAHSEMIHTLQEGYAELRALLDAIDLDAFLDQTFSTRIGNRVLAEHFLAVNAARVRLAASKSDVATLSKGGIVDPNCRPADLVRNLAGSLGELCADIYGVDPGIALEGQVDTEFSFVPEHLGFVLQEVLKNALRATAEEHCQAMNVPSVSVEIMKGSFDVTIKVSDLGGGMRRETVDQIWRYGYTTTTDDHHEPPATMHGGVMLPGRGGLVGEQLDVRRMAGYGFGLPLSRVYARYFGGDITVQTMLGHGTDVYINVNHLGDAQEHESEALPTSKLKTTWTLS